MLDGETIGKQRYCRSDDVAFSLSGIPELKSLNSVIVTELITRSRIQKKMNGGH